MKNQMEYDLENPLTLSLKEYKNDIIPRLFASESDHMPSRNLLQCLKSCDLYVSFRQEAISLILQAQYSCNYHPSVPYLAVNYLDRFISRQEIPQGKPWVLRLLVISCLSLAAKMMNRHFPVSDFQASCYEGFIFDTRSISRMELLILDGLDWRMRSITPFSFLCFFISLLQLQDQKARGTLKDRATEMIFKAQNEIKLLEFKPSIIAASSLLVACHELFPFQFPSFKCSISSCQFVRKKLQKCYNALQEMLEMESLESMVESTSSARTPQSVLERHYWTKSESRETTTTTSLTNINTICADQQYHHQQIKRRKLNGCPS
ncbi:hypothetical protein Tsubulata_025144 [Turnera subulata]|uniref:B-like cyclin n=1 Tax=Turnera subulata TaxID=218843 RepID=A0A9Q0FGE7_9ROSI|nr:hypothetical protein Tsubulata_025144 [Turnera subulata]